MQWQRTPVSIVYCTRACVHGSSTAAGKGPHSTHMGVYGAEEKSSLSPNRNLRCRIQNSLVPSSSISCVRISASPPCPATSVAERDAWAATHPTGVQLVLVQPFTGTGVACMRDASAAVEPAATQPVPALVPVCLGVSAGSSSS
jgi:hypothetical protein